MNEFLKNILAKYAKDRGVWVAVATWIAHMASKKLGVNLDTDMLVSGLVALAAWGVTHLLHVNTIVDKPKEIEVPTFDNKN